jgi:rRNA-processing protein FCF1
MKSTRAIYINLLAILLLVGLIAHAQTPTGDTKHFAKDGLIFDYPNGWTIEDRSNNDALQLTLGRADSEAQIIMFVHRGRVDTPEKIAQAKRAFIDPYIKYTNDNLVQMGAKPEQTSASTQISGAQAEGVRLRATLDSEPGEATIYWLTLNNHVVVLTFFGSDKSLKQAMPAWDAIRNSLHIEEAKAAPKSTPK